MVALNSNAVKSSFSTTQGLIRQISYVEIHIFLAIRYSFESVRYTFEDADGLIAKLRASS